MTADAWYDVSTFIHSTASGMTHTFVFSCAYNLVDTDLLLSFVHGKNRF